MYKENLKTIQRDTDHAQFGQDKDDNFAILYWALLALFYVLYFWGLTKFVCSLLG